MCPLGECSELLLLTLCLADFIDGTGLFCSFNLDLVDLVIKRNFIVSNWNW